MSTIAYDGEWLVADGGVTSNDCHVGTARKIWNVGGDMFAATVGDLGLSRPFILHLQKCGIGPFDTRDGCFGAIVVHADKVWLYGDDGLPCEVEAEYYAKGSGSDFARAALHITRDAVVAVTTACWLDTYSNFPVIAINTITGEEKTL